MPGIGVPADTDFNNDPGNWNNTAFLDYFKPDAGWAGYNLGGAPAGAFDSAGNRQGMTLKPFSGLAENNGYGWQGPLIIQQRYPLPYLWYEAESGVLTAPMSKFDDTAASGGSYIKVDVGSLNDPADTYPGGADYIFSTGETGTYHVWVRAYFPDSASNSLWATVDNITPYTYVGNPTFNVWQWIKIYYSGVNLSSGLHSLNIKYREDGTRIDKFLITNDAAYIPAGLGW